MHGWIDYSMIKGGGLTPRMFHLYEETFDDYLERVRSDLQQSIQELEDRYHTKIDCFAYPFGAYDKDTLNRVKESGFKLAFTFHREEQFVYPHSNPYTLDRIPVLRNTKLFQLIPSP
jgi:peptidoglycan/xylan/chitin deacetylase (PgdA/CDA1 family)